MSVMRGDGQGTQVTQLGKTRPRRGAGGRWVRRGVAFRRRRGAASPPVACPATPRLASEMQARELECFFSRRPAGWSRRVQSKKQIAGGFPDSSSERQSSKENDPPGRTRPLQEAEEEETRGRTSPERGLALGQLRFHFWLKKVLLFV